jgi:2-polyprenyl-3-methyl-5-hydroxy-6-metoxy-1,4-benzoquinol methylase
MSNTGNFRKYTSRNPIQKYLINNFLRTVCLCLEDLKINSILDAGCGEGFVLSEFKKRGIGNFLEGIDSSEEALNTGRELFPYLSLKLGNIYNLPYEDESFDLVICAEVMEHLNEPDKVMEEIVRVSRKYCLLSVPNEPLFMISNFLRGKNILRWGSDIDHLQHWSSRAFKRFIQRNLKIVTLKRPFPWTVILSTIKR